VTGATAGGMLGRSTRTGGRLAVFDPDAFVADCIAALDEDAGAPAAIRELLDRTVRTPGLGEAIGDATSMPSMTTWHTSDRLTVLHIVWPPDADLHPHDHNMWAAIGLYGGREDNHFYRRRPDGRIDEAGGRTLRDRDVVGLGSDVVHRVVNPTKEWTGAIHVYGGDFFNTPRTRWSLRTGEPQPFDAEVVSAYLEETAAAARCASTE
jgi:predicted metal-dependent enzyme (double-stranded beta helix superfamily)